MILVIDTNGLIRTLFHFNEGTLDGDELVDDTLDRFQIRLDNLKEWAENLAVRLERPKRCTCDASRDNGLVAQGLEPEGCPVHLDEPPPHVKLICAFDSRAECFRRKIIKEYKAQRTHNPLAYVTVEECYKMLKNSDDWQRMMSPDGYEADDLIASIAHQADEPVIIHANDKDYNSHLVDGRVGIIKRSGAFEGVSVSGIQYSEFETVVYTARDFVREYDLQPPQFVDVQILQGDAADNVSGAVGIGAVRAKRLIQLFGSAEGAIEAAKQSDERIPSMKCGSAIAKGLVEFEPLVSKTRQVIELRTDLEIPQLVTV